MTNRVMQANAKKLKRVLNDRDYTNLDVGRIGRFASDGTINPDATDGCRDGWLWVRMGTNGERGQTQVINAGINTAYIDAPVKIGTRPTDGERCAYAVEYNSETIAVYGGSLIAAANPVVPTLTDTQVKDGKLINIGRVSPSILMPDTLYVYVQPFFYNNLLLGGMDYDVGTANVPTNAGERRWVVIGVDTTNTATTITGTTGVYNTVDLLLKDMATSIAIPSGVIPVGLLTLSYAQTAIKESRFEDARYWLTPRGTLLSESSEIKTIASGVATAGNGSFLIVAAQSGTADDLDTITMSGIARLILLQADSGDTITVKHSTGNIELNGGADYALSGDKTLLLFWDGTNLADISIPSSGTTTYYQTVKDNGSAETQRAALNFIAGSNVTLTITDDAGNNETDITIASSSGSAVPDYILIRDEKSSGTAGGTFTTGARRVRDLNTEVSDTGNHASVASNQITLAAGTYTFAASAPSFAANRVKLALYNVTDTVDIAIGGNGNSNATAGETFVSTVEGKFVIASTKVLELQHECSTTSTTNGFGLACSLGTEVYSVIEFWKVA